MKNYISQGFIIIGYLIFFISRFRKNKKSILMTDNLSRICFIIGYYLLNSLNSIEHTIYGIVRNTIGQKLISKNKIYKVFGFLILLIILCIMYGLSFNGFSTIMFILSGLINLFAIVFAKEQGIRLGTTLAAICNITAFVIIGSYASIIGETLCGFMGVLSFIKGYKNSNDAKIKIIDNIN
mgnify:CR=1 FL=1